MLLILQLKEGRRKGEIDGQIFSRRWLDGTALKGRWSLHVTLPRAKIFRNDRRNSSKLIRIQYRVDRR